MAAVPAALAGNTVGFHLLHLGLFAAVPALVCADCRIARWPFSTAALAGGLAALAAWNYWSFLIRSGDTNSLAGVVACTATLVSAHAAREGHGCRSMGFVLARPDRLRASRVLRLRPGPLGGGCHRCPRWQVCLALLGDLCDRMDRRLAPDVGVLALSVVFPLQQRAVGKRLALRLEGICDKCVLQRRDYSQADRSTTTRASTQPLPSCNRLCRAPAPQSLDVPRVGPAGSHGDGTD